MSLLQQKKFCYLGMERFYKIWNFSPSKNEVNGCGNFNLFSAEQERIVSLNLSSFIWFKKFKH